MDDYRLLEEIPADRREVVPPGACGTPQQDAEAAVEGALRGLGGIAAGSDSVSCDIAELQALRIYGQRWHKNR